MNKIMFLFLSISLCLCNKINAQAFKTSYAYDNNGNRISATIIYLVKAMKYKANSETDTFPSYFKNGLDTAEIPAEGWGPSIDDVLSSFSIKLYPNPNHGRLIVELNNISEQQTAVNSIDATIYDLQGKKVWQQSGLKRFTAIDFSSLSNGTYILELNLINQVKKYTIIKN